MPRLSILTDEHVKRAYVSALRANGFEVLAVAAGERAGREDRTHLVTNHERDCVILTNDGDFVRLGQQYPHGGIIYYRDQSHRPGEVVTAIRRIDRQFDPGQMHEHIEWLENWL